MRLTNRKKKILNYFDLGNREWITGDICAPPFDVICVAWLIYRVESHGKRHCLESTRRTLETMVKDGLLEKSSSYERHQDTTQSDCGAGVWCKASRYGLPGQCAVVSDDEGKNSPLFHQRKRYLCLPVTSLRQYLHQWHYCQPNPMKC